MKQLNQVKKTKKGKKMSVSLQQVQNKQINISHQISKVEKLAEITRNGTEDPPIRHTKKALTAVDDMEMDVKIRPHGPEGFLQCILSVDGVQISCAEASTKKKAKRMAFKIALNLLTSGKPLVVKKSSEGFYRLGPKVGFHHSTESSQSVKEMKVNSPIKVNDGSVSSKTKSFQQKQSQQINVSHQIIKFEKLAEAIRCVTEFAAIKHFTKAINAVEDMEMHVKMRPHGQEGASICILSVDGVQIASAVGPTKKRAKRMAFRFAIDLLMSGKPLHLIKSPQGFYELKDVFHHSTESSQSVKEMKVNSPIAVNDGSVSSKTLSFQQKQSQQINVSHQIIKFEKLAEAIRCVTDLPAIKHFTKAINAVEDMEMHVKMRPHGQEGASICILSVDGVQIAYAVGPTKKRAKRMAFRFAIDLLMSGKPLHLIKSPQGFYELKDVLKLKQPAPELVDVSRFVLMKPLYQRSLTSESFLTHSVSFNDTLMRHTYENVADKIKCTLSVGGLEVGSGMHAREAQAKCQAVDDALSFFEKRCYTIVEKEGIEVVEAIDKARMDEGMSVDDALFSSKEKRLPKILDHIIKSGGCTRTYEIIPPKQSNGGCTNFYEIIPPKHLERNTNQDDFHKVWKNLTDLELTKKKNTIKIFN